MTSSRPARRFGWDNLAIRVASAVGLGPVGVVATYWTSAFLLMVAVAVALLALEWGQMSAPGAPVRVATAITAGALAAIFAAYARHFVYAWLLMLLGALVAAYVARNVSERRRD